MELREIENEAEEQRSEAWDMTEEIEEHKARAEILEQAVAQLKTVQDSVQSEGLRQALQQAENAKHATEERFQALREERDAILEQNRALADKLKNACDVKQEAMRKLPMLQRGRKPLKPEAEGTAPFYQQMEIALEEDISRTQLAQSLVYLTRKMLEHLEI